MHPRLLLRLLPFLVGFACLAPQACAGAAPAPTFKKGVNISHWLSQNNERRPYGADWFTEEDVAWIAAQGFDHIRFPIDGRLWLKADGSLDLLAIEPFDRALKWVKKNHLNAILDMHFLPGADFNDGGKERAAFSDPVVQAKVAEFWRKVARRYADEGMYLRFEIINEPVADTNEQVNGFSRSMLAAIRESNPTRIVYLPCNQYNSVHTVTDVAVPNDPNVAITVHFYEPLVFTHQRAAWVKLPADMPPVPFPGKVPDLTKLVPADSFGAKVSGTELTVATDIDAPFAAVAEWAKAKAPGREIYLGEFGVYTTADSASRQAWLRAVVGACARHDFGWAIWDYQGGFAVRDREGNPTDAVPALLGK